MTKKVTLDQVMEELSKLRADMNDMKADMKADMKELSNRVQANEDEMLLLSNGPYGAPPPIEEPFSLHEVEEDYFKYFDHGGS